MTEETKDQIMWFGETTLLVAFIIFMILTVIYAVK